MFSFPYGQQVLFPVCLSIFATCCLGYAVLDCNFVEITNDTVNSNIHGVSVGFWRTMDELNGKFDEDRFKCVPWTSEQSDTFDPLWNYGRYGGALSFALSLWASSTMALTTCCTLSYCMERFLGMVQLLLAFTTAMMLTALESSMCHEFDCWLDVGGILTITASAIYLFCGWMTLGVGFAHTTTLPRPRGGDDAKRPEPTEIVDDLEEP